MSAQVVPTRTPALRELSTDQPDKTEAPQTVEVSHVRIELDVATYLHDLADRATSDDVAVLPFNLGTARIAIRTCRSSSRHCSAPRGPTQPARRTRPGPKT